jgi:NAD(P)H-flavin reductase
MAEVEFVKELEGDWMYPGQKACVVKRGADYFQISTIVSAPDHGGPETLAFACDEDGEVTSYTDLAGGRGWSREDTIKELAEKGPAEESFGRGLFGDTKPVEERTPGEKAGGLLTALDVIAKEMRRGTP